MSGTLYGLGIGPGDPELLTLKALRLIQAAPVIAYPAPEVGESLARAIAAPHIPAGRREIAIRMPLEVARFPAQAVYDKAAEEIAAELEVGRDVAVLCEGDPFFYGSFMYLWERLSGRFPVEVVPGVSSLTACAARSGHPMASRNDVLTVVPAPLDDARLEAVLAGVEAAAVIKVGRHLPRLRALLQRLGLWEDAKAVIRATMAEERICAASDLAEEESLPYFSMLLVHRRKRATA